MRRPWDARLGLALGGGAARGLAHIGVLRVFERAGIRPDIVVGTSMGAIVGAAYAAGLEVEEIRGRIETVLTSERFRRNRLSFLRETKHERGGMLYSVANLVRKGIVYGVSSVRPSFLAAEEFARDIESIVPEIPIESCPRSFAAIALDLDSGRELVIRRGDLRHAVAASAAIPGILPPVELDGRAVIDGGWIDKTPVIPTFALGADVVVSVDISADLEDTADYRRALDVVFRANAVKDHAHQRFSRALADVSIEPDVAHVHWAEFERFEDCYAAGEAAAAGRVDAIRAAVARARWTRPFIVSLGRRVAQRFGSAIDYGARAVRPARLPGADDHPQRDQEE